MLTRATWTSPALASPFADRGKEFPKPLPLSGVAAMACTHHCGDGPGYRWAPTGPDAPQQSPSHPGPTTPAATSGASHSDPTRPLSPPAATPEPDQSPTPSNTPPADPNQHADHDWTPAHTPPHHQPDHHPPRPCAQESAGPPAPRAPARSPPETSDKQYAGSPQPIPPNPPDSHHQLEHTYCLSA
jgi:hypothetical protein